METIEGQDLFRIWLEIWLGFIVIVKFWFICTYDTRSLFYKQLCLNSWKNNEILKKKIKKPFCFSIEDLPKKNQNFHYGFVKSG